MWVIWYRVRFYDFCIMYCGAGCGGWWSGICGFSDCLSVVYGLATLYSCIRIKYFCNICDWMSVLIISTVLDTSGNYQNCFYRISQYEWWMSGAQICTFRSKTFLKYCLICKLWLSAWSISLKIERYVTKYRASPSFFYVSFICIYYLWKKYITILLSSP